MTYQKTYDLLDLAIWMQSTREGVSLNDIADKYNISRRTAERMRDLIITQFPQTQEIIGDNNQKRWYIPQGTLKDFIQFSAEELSTLETAYTLFGNKQMLDKQEVMQKLIQKIKASIKTDIYRRIDVDAEALLEAEGFICRPGPKLITDNNIIATIRQAILQCHQIKITYNKHGKISYFTLDPHGFLYGERNHYLVARHSDGYYGDNVHNFILNNILKVEILDKIFVPIQNFNLQKYAQQSFGAYQEEPFEVEWLFASEVADEAAQYIFHPKQEMIKNKDGTLTVKFKAGGRLEMDWHLYTWGKHVKVIKPTDWYEKIEQYYI